MCQYIIGPHAPSINALIKKFVPTFILHFKDDICLNQENYYMGVVVGFSPTTFKVILNPLGVSELTKKALISCMTLWPFQVLVHTPFSVLLKYRIQMLLPVVKFFPIPISSFNSSKSPLQLTSYADKVCLITEVLKEE